jgi:hypothetical protein
MRFMRARCVISDSARAAVRAVARELVWEVVLALRLEERVVIWYLRRWRVREGAE